MQFNFQKPTIDFLRRLKRRIVMSPDSNEGCKIPMGNARDVVKGGGPGIPEWAFRLKNK